MVGEDLTDLDRRILHLLQVNARGKRDTDIADETDVTSTTIAKHIRSLEDRGIIKGYHPEIDYEAAGYPLVVLFICTVPVPEREAIANEVLDIRGVVNVKQLLTGRGNLHVQVVAESTARIEAITEQLDEMGIQIVSNVIVSSETAQPWDHFQEDLSSGGPTDSDSATEA